MAKVVHQKTVKLLDLLGATGATPAQSIQTTVTPILQQDGIPHHTCEERYRGKAIMGRSLRSPSVRWVAVE